MLKVGRRLVLAGLLAGLLGVHPGRGLSRPNAGLFADSPISGALDFWGRPEIVRTRFVTVDLRALGGTPDVPPQDTLTLNLFPDAVFTARLRYIERAPGGYVWVGRIEGKPLSDVLLSVVGDIMMGSIIMPGAVYSIEYAGGEYGGKKVHAIHEINQGAFPPDEGPAGPLIPPEDSSTAPLINKPTAMATSTKSAMEASGQSTLNISAPDTDAFIDIMVVYTPAARAAAGGTTAMQAHVNLMISQTNAAYANSNITTRLRLVYTAEVSYTESGDMGLDLDRITNCSDGFMDIVCTWRDTYAADLVALIVETGQYCGIAWLNDSPADASRGFSVTRRICATSNATFAHEIGHNQGMCHDWYVEGPGCEVFGWATYSYGYVDDDPGDRWLTIMAYYTRCSDQGFSCTKILYFSNPNVLYNGQPTGVNPGTNTSCLVGQIPATECDADNARTLNESDIVIANFRQSKRTKVGVVYDWGWGLGWYLDANGNGAWDGCGVDRCFFFGGAGSKPVAGDWNGDGKTDAGVVYDWGWGLGWYLDANGNGAWDGCGVDRCFFFGGAGSKPVAGDWNGDGKTDAGVVHDWGWGLGWYLDANGNGAWDGCLVDRCFFFGSGSSGSALVGHAGFEAAAMGGGWGLPLTGVSGGLAAVSQVAASAVAAGTRFQRVYTIPPWSPGPLEAAPTADGGFILAGIVGNPSFSSDFFVMKTDAAGNMQWSRTYNVLQKDGGGLPPEGGRAFDLVPTPDGGFLLAGSTCCDGGKAVAEVLKINGSGDVLWNKTYRSSSVHISIRRAVATSDGDFLLIGHSGPDATSYRMFAAKIGPDGMLRWSRTYDVPDTGDTLRDVAPTPDGGALLVGELFHYSVVLAFKIDANGNVDWARMYGEQSSGDTTWEDPTVVRLPGGDFMLAGSAYNNRIGYGYDWVMRIDSGGNVRWVKSVGFGVGFMVPLSDGNLLLVGGAPSDTGFPDVAATKMTPDGVVQWRRRYGRRYGDSVAAAATVSDGGFLLAGLSSNDSGNEDLYLVRADATGSSGCLEQDLPPVQVTPIDLGFIGTPIVQATDVALAVEALPPSVETLMTQGDILCTTEAPPPQVASWSRIYGGPNYDEAFALAPTSDGGYVVAGRTASFGVRGGGDDVWVLKLDGQGNVVWQKTYGGTNIDQAFALARTSDGGYVVAGRTASFGAGWDDVWVLKLDGQGNVVWQKTYGGTGDDGAYALAPTSDGGYVVAGYTRSFGGGAWVLKLDGQGNVVWQKTSSLDEARAIIPTSDGGYVVAGKTYYWAGRYNVWVLKLDGQGNVQWQKNYGGTDDDEAYAIAPTSDGGYVVAGWTKSFGAGSKDVWVLKLDGQGNVQWQKTYGGTGDDEARAIAPTSGGGYVVAGWTKSFGAGSKDVWVLKLEADGTMRGCPPGLVRDSTASVGSTSASPGNSSAVGQTTSASVASSSATVGVSTSSAAMVCGCTVPLAPSSAVVGTSNASVAEVCSGIGFRLYLPLVLRMR